jgi:FkbM family methyltransferase
MPSVRRFLREAIIAAAKAVLGRKYLFRITEALSFAIRLEHETDASRDGEWDVQRAVAEAVPASEELIVFDVGANVGAWTTAMVRFRSGRPLRVHAFEPAPRVAAILRERVAGFGASVTVVEAAAGQTDGSTRLFFRPDNTLISSVVDFGEAASHPVEVATTRLDTYVQARGIARIHLLKIDAEGYDLEVLRSALPLLRERRIDVVQFEYAQWWIFSRNFLREAFELLEPLGYRLGKVTPDGIERYQRWQPVMETFHGANFVACLDGDFHHFRTFPPPWPE